MTYQVLARKWRPKTFTAMIGQEATVRTLTNALSQHRLHHAYLFTGTRGVGKTTVARILAKCLNCEQNISATPCGKCNHCTAIDAGQFVDLIEVDAASRTKVEDTRELLENVQYAPNQGRFKIYLIDEVHMLSTHSFNALLKTLEEPPPHVKFLLATTDPQKLPITILSRCLQFHLKAIPAEIISQHLTYISTQEKISYAENALLLLANAAKGSMRDALSLLDQAIAFTNSQIDEESVQKLLGTTANIDLYPLLQALSNENGTELLQHVDKLAMQGVDFPQILTDLLALLQQIAILQIVGEKPNTDAQLIDLAKQFSAEDIQLFYQIGLLGQRDSPYAPTPRSGFEMVLLRMLSFVPEAMMQAPTNKNKVQKSTPPDNKHTANNTSQENTDWQQLTGKLNLTGMTKVLADNCILQKLEEHQVHLLIDAKHASFANTTQHQQLETALQEKFGSGLKLVIKECTNITDTPAQQIEVKKSKALAAAKSNLIADPHVQSILEDFGGVLDENSISLVKS